MRQRVLIALLLLLPQAARANTMTSARIRVRVFFILCISFAKFREPPKDRNGPAPLLRPKNRHLILPISELGVF